jgi:hypothetical protein
MEALENFDFSQSSLQDFTDCRKRFSLRYIQNVAWPAVQAEPVIEFERHIQRGDRFHRLAQQFLIGIPEDKLTHIAASDEDEHLLQWWEHFLDEIPERLSGQKLVEALVTAETGRHRLVAKYDLVLIQPDERIVIYDWKTSTHRPKRESLLERLQTRVYPYVLVKGGAAVKTKRAVPADRVEMVYWFAEPGMPSETITYSEDQFRADEAYLAGMLEEITMLDRSGFVMTSDEKHCRYCVYRSLCGRGTRAADLNPADTFEIEAAESENLDFTIEQIGEVFY